MSDTSHTLPSDQRQTGLRQNGQKLIDRLRAGRSGANGQVRVDTQGQTGTDCRDLLRYWNATRTGLALPRRSDIDPRGIAGMLSKTFILEEIAPGLARFRVAGAHLGAFLGMDVRGMPLSALLLPEARDDLADALQQVFDKPGILRAVLVSPASFGKTELEAELLILPLRDDRDEVTRAIGCLVARGEIGKAPRRFTLRHLRVDPVSVVKAPQPTRPILTRDQQDASTSHETPHLSPARPRFAPPKPGQPSYLRLVVTE